MIQLILEKEKESLHNQIPNNNQQYKKQHIQLRNLYMLFILSAQFLHNNLVKFCCARLNIFKLCVLKTLILKGFDRYDLPIALCPLKRAPPFLKKITFYGIITYQWRYIWEQFCVYFQDCGLDYVVLPKIRNNYKRLL